MVMHTPLLIIMTMMLIAFSHIFCLSPQGKWINEWPNLEHSNSIQIRLISQEWHCCVYPRAGSVCVCRWWAEGSNCVWGSWAKSTWPHTIRTVVSGVSGKSGEEKWHFVWSKRTLDLSVTMWRNHLSSCYCTLKWTKPASHNKEFMLHHYRFSFIFLLLFRLPPSFHTLSHLPPSLPPLSLSPSF